MKLNKKQLDILSSIFGLIAGLCGVLVVNDVAPVKLWGTTGGIATVLLGYTTQRPANKNPTTEQVEERVTHE